MTDFASIEWESFPASGTSDAGAWYKNQVPYRSDANALQTLDIWIPAVKSEALPPVDTFSECDGAWVVYIHGGAWRDPLVTSTSFTTTVENVLQHHVDAIDKIAGFASISYSLSPYPNHPTSPSPPKDAAHPVDPSRQAKHPDHILDVLTALEFLQSKTGMSDNYILLGHSCGATLALQVAMDHSRWGSSLQVDKPKALIGLNGLYDLPSLIKTPGERYEKYISIYEDFTRLAFGDDERDWQKVSPASVQSWKDEWSEGRLAVLVQSREDTLVPFNQLESMRTCLQKSFGRQVIEMDATGDHNDLWISGVRLAQIIVDVIQRL